MARKTWAYIGSGEVKMREVGAEAPFVVIGNCSVLQFSAEVDSKELQNFMRPGGGTYAKVDRIGSVGVNITVHDLDGKNLAMASNGLASTKAGDTGETESLAAYGGGTTPFAFPPKKINSVKDEATGMITYDEGPEDDYIMTPSGIYIPDGSSIVDPVGGAANIAVDYDYDDLQIVQAVASSGKEFEFLFEGLNEVESDAAVIVRAYRVKFSPAQNIDFIGDDFAGLELAGTALPDTSIVSSALSQYWKATLVV